MRSMRIMTSWWPSLFSTLVKSQRMPPTRPWLSQRWTAILPTVQVRMTTRMKMKGANKEAIRESWASTWIAMWYARPWTPWSFWPRDTEPCFSTRDMQTAGLGILALLATLTDGAWWRRARRKCVSVAWSVCATSASTWPANSVRPNRPIGPRWRTKCITWWSISISIIIIIIIISSSSSSSLQCITCPDTTAARWTSTDPLRGTTQTWSIWWNWRSSSVLLQEATPLAAPRKGMRTLRQWPPNVQMKLLTWLKANLSLLEKAIALESERAKVMRDRMASEQMVARRDNQRLHGEHSPRQSSSAEERKARLHHDGAKRAYYPKGKNKTSNEILYFSRDFSR